MTERDARAEILRLVRANTRMTAAQLGRAAGVSRQRASLILGEAGWRLESRWVEGKKGKGR